MTDEKTTPITRRCPKCGQEYTDRPAISRLDNVTPICPDCGTREALDSLGVGAEEQAEIIETIHKAKAENN